VLPIVLFAQSAGGYPATGGRVDITQARGLLLPNTSINTRTAGQAIPALDTPVLVYCRSGNRSAQAARSLTALGYTRVYDLGAITAWDGDLVRP